MKKYLLSVAVLVSFGSGTNTAAPSLESLRFLIGTWKADRDPATGASGQFSFEMKAQNHAIIRNNYSETAATAERPASRHDDVMTIYVEGDTIKADYVDSEGHVIRYLVDVGTNRVAFLSVATPAEPRYKLSYRLDASGILNGAFEIAPPGRPDNFGPYLAWTARKINY